MSLVAFAAIRLDHFVVCVSKSRQHDLFNTVCSTCSGQAHSVGDMSKSRQHDLCNTVCCTCYGQVRFVIRVSKNK